jgi:hypothetical protein
MSTTTAPPDPRDVNPSVITALLDDSAATVENGIDEAPETYSDVLKATAITVHGESAFSESAAAEAYAFARSLLAKHHAAPAMTKAIGALARFKHADTTVKAPDFVDASAYFEPFARASMNEVVRIAREKFGTQQLFPIPAVYRTDNTKWATVRARDTISGDVKMVAIRALVRTNIELVSYHVPRLGQRWIELIEGGKAASSSKVTCTQQLADLLDERSNPDDTTLAFPVYALDAGDIVFLHPAMPVKCMPYRNTEVNGSTKDDVAAEDFLVQTLALTTVDNTAAWATAEAANGIIQETLLGAYLGTGLIRYSEKDAVAKPVFKPLVPAQRTVTALQTALDIHAALEERIRAIRDRDAQSNMHVWDTEAFEATASKHRATGASVSVNTYKASLCTLAEKVAMVEKDYGEFVALEVSVKTAWAQLHSELGDNSAAKERMNGNHKRTFNSLVKLYEENLKDVHYASFKAITKVSAFVDGVARLIKTINEVVVDAVEDGIPIVPTENDYEELPPHMAAGDDLKTFIRTHYEQSLRNGVIWTAVIATKRPEWEQLWLDFRNDFKAIAMGAKADAYTTAVNVAPFEARFRTFLDLARPRPVEKRKKAAKKKRAREEDEEEAEKNAIDLAGSSAGDEDEDNDPAMRIHPKDPAFKRDAEGKPMLDANGDPILLSGDKKQFIVEDDEDDDEEDDDDSSSSSSGGVQSDGGDDEADENFENVGRSGRLRKRIERSKDDSLTLSHRLLHCKRRAINVREWEELADQYCALNGNEKNKQVLVGLVAQMELRTQLWAVYKRDKKTGLETLLGTGYYPSESAAQKVLADRKLTFAEAEIEDPCECTIRANAIIN